jgi:hypothetical protein
MLGLSATDQSLEIVLAGSSVSALHVSATYKEITTVDADSLSVYTASNGTTAVTIVPAPSAGLRHLIERVTVYNPNVLSATVTIRVNVGGTPHIQAKVPLGQDERLEYSDKHGWRAFTSDNAIKSTPGYHSTLTGLDNNDHPQYVLKEGDTWEGAMESTTVLGAGSYSLQIFGGAGAARSIVRFGQIGFSNGFTVTYDNTQMHYGFLDGNVTIGAPVSGNTLTVNAVSGGVAMYATGNLSGGLVYNYIQNSSSGAGSAAALIIAVGSGSTGDPYLRFDSAGGTFWTLGSDSSDSNSFVLSASTALGTSNALRVTGARNWEIPAPSSGTAFTLVSQVASAAQAALTRGVDDSNFILLARNGTSGSGSGTVMGSFGLEYAGTTTSVSTGLLFKRGAGATDGSLEFWAGNASRGSISSAGGWTVPVPDSGTAVVVNAKSGEYAMNINGASSSFAGIRFLENSTGKWVLTSGTDGAGVFSVYNLAAGNTAIKVDANSNVISHVQTSAPSLGTNQDMVFALTSNTNLRVSVRGTDGTTRVANLTLA